MARKRSSYLHQYESVEESLFFELFGCNEVHSQILKRVNTGSNSLSYEAHNKRYIKSWNSTRTLNLHLVDSSWKEMQCVLSVISTRNGRFYAGKDCPCDMEFPVVQRNA